MTERKKTLSSQNNNTIRDKIVSAKLSPSRTIKLENSYLTLDQLKLFAPTMKGITSIYLSVLLSIGQNILQLPLSLLPYLKSLTINSEDDTKLLDLDISIIGSCINLLDLHLGDNIAISTLNTISGCKLLNTLRVDYCPKITKLTGVDNFVYLERLSLNKCNMLEDIKSLSSCNNLKQLTISYNNKLEDLSDISDCVNLAKISFSHCTMLQSTNGINGCVSLESAIFIQCPALKDISSIGECQGIKGLYFQKY